MDRQSDQALRAHLERLLQGRIAHMDLREVVADHNAYPLGELTALRATLDIGPESGWW